MGNQLEIIDTYINKQNTVEGDISLYHATVNTINNYRNIKYRNFYKCYGAILSDRLESWIHAHDNLLTDNLKKIYNNILKVKNSFDIHDKRDLKDTPFEIKHNRYVEIYVTFDNDMDKLAELYMQFNKEIDVVMEGIKTLSKLQWHYHYSVYDDMKYYDKIYMELFNLKHETKIEKFYSCEFKYFSFNRDADMLNEGTSSFIFIDLTVNHLIKSLVASSLTNSIDNYQSSLKNLIFIINHGLFENEKNIINSEFLDNPGVNYIYYILHQIIAIDYLSENQKIQLINNLFMIIFSGILKTDKTEIYNNPPDMSDTYRNFVKHNRNSIPVAENLINLLSEVDVHNEDYFNLTNLKFTNLFNTILNFYEPEDNIKINNNNVSQDILEDIDSDGSDNIILNQNEGLW